MIVLVVVMARLSAMLLNYLIYFLIGRTHEVVAEVEVAVGAEVAVHLQDGNVQY